MDVDVDVRGGVGVVVDVGVTLVAGGDVRVCVGVVIGVVIDVCLLMLLFML